MVEVARTTYTTPPPTYTTRAEVACGRRLQATIYREDLTAPGWAANVTTVARRTKRDGRSEAAEKVGHLTGPAAPARYPSPLGTAFAPTPHQRLALSAVIEEPSLAAHKRALARSTGLSSRSLSRWFADAGFRAWWNRALLDIARDRMGESALELHRIVSDSSSDVARVRAAEAMVRLFGQPQTGIAEAVTAILERWGRGRARMVAGEGGGVALEVEGEATDPPAQSAEVRGASHNDYYRNQSAEVRRAGAPPPGAMATSPTKADELAARARLDARVREGRVYVEDLGGEGVVDARDPTIPRTPPSPSSARPRLAPREGVGENHKPAEGEQQSSTGSPSPANRPPPGRRYDFRGRLYTPRSGPKAPPSGAPDVPSDPEDPFT